MPELAFIRHVTKSLYALQPQSIESLQPHVFDWRGIYQLRGTSQRSWLLRLLRLPDAADALTQTATLLHWLARQHYLAPCVYATTDQQLVGQIDGWATLLLSFIEGAVLETDASDLSLLGQTVGRLHALPLDTTASFPLSRCHPDEVCIKTTTQLASGRDKLPRAFRPLATALYESIEPIQSHTYYLCLTHGDCWYMNAVKTSNGKVVLIDWDCAGVGLPILDLGYLLLTSHYELARPLQIQADENKIRAIMRGYQQIRQLSSSEQDMIVSAVRFALAFQLGEYIDQDEGFRSDDLVLKKMQVRFDVTEQIAQIAKKYFKC
jgi:Ser/Thr protein kinase RdoA (MazF antagonist)